MKQFVPAIALVATLAVLLAACSAPSGNNSVTSLTQLQKAGKFLQQGVLEQVSGKPAGIYPDWLSFDGYAAPALYLLSSPSGHVSAKWSVGNKGNSCVSLDLELQYAAGPEDYGTDRNAPWNISLHSAETDDPYLSVVRYFPTAAVATAFFNQYTAATTNCTKLHGYSYSDDGYSGDFTPGPTSTVAGFSDSAVQKLVPTKGGRPVYTGMVRDGNIVLVFYDDLNELDAHHGSWNAGELSKVLKFEIAAINDARKK